MLEAVDGLLTIGEFSAACGLSPKVLRTYAADGLLRPAVVDRGSGYRYYAPEQVPRARTIAGLRRAGTPLRDIARFLDDPAAELLDQWQRDLDAEAAQRRRALEEVRLTVAAGAGPPAAGARPAAGSASQRGGARPVNQDAVLLGEELFAVADGMGDRGEIASVLAVEVLQAGFAPPRSPDGLAGACRAAGRAVWRRAQEAAAEPTAATTLTAAWISHGADPAVTIVSVGDSRAYLLRGSGVRRLTQDHSLVADLVRSGEISEPEARTHPRRSLLTRALGTGPDVQPGLVRVPCEPADRLLLCTDGLSGELDDQEIAEVLAAGLGPGEAADELVRLARGRGGSDDASAVVVDVLAAPPAA